MAATRINLNGIHELDLNFEGVTTADVSQGVVTVTNVGAAGNDVEVNGTVIPAPNFNSTTPAATGGVNVTFEVSGSDVTAKVPAATTTSPGVVQPDGTTITITDGVISSSGGGGTSVEVNGATVLTPNLNSTTPAAPTGGVNATLTVSGSDVAVGIPAATASAPGVVQPDGTTITVSNGVITAVGGGGGGTSVYTGTGAPTTFHSTGSLYFDTSATPAHGYAQIAVQGLAPSVDTTGTPVSAEWSGGTSCSASISTSTNAKLLCVAVTYEKSGVTTNVSSVNSTSGLVFTCRALAESSYNGNTGVELWTAPLTVPLSGENVTVTVGQPIDDGCISVFALQNVAASPMNTGAGFPVELPMVSGSSGLVATGLYTNLPNTLLIYVSGTNTHFIDGAPGGPGLTFTEISTPTNQGGALWSYMQVSISPQTSELVNQTFNSYLNTGWSCACVLVAISGPGSSPSWLQFS